MNLSNDRPEKIQRIGLSLFAYNYNIKDVIAEENQQCGFEYETIIFDHIPTCNECINKIINTKYPIGEENAIQRKGIIDNTNAEFVAYNEIVEQVKNKVKADFNNE